MKCFNPLFSIGIIPTSYLDSLSYLEQIMCINQKLCEIIETLNSFSFDEIENLINEKIEELKNYVDNNDEKLYNYIDENYKNLFNELVTLINELISMLINYVNNSDELLKLELENQIDELKNSIDDIIIKGINVYNPTTGQMDNIQNVVFDLYKYLRYYGITAFNFDNLGLSAQEFQNKNLTARQFDLYSKNILETDFLHNMYSPFNGEITSISEVVQQLATLHKSELTAQGFDNLDLTAQEFDNKDLTAYQFDWQGALLLA